MLKIKTKGLFLILLYEDKIQMDGNGGLLKLKVLKIIFL